MKSIKILLAAMEICCLLGVLCLAFSTSVEQFMGHYFRAAYISLLAALAVVLQREQQQISWDDED